MGKTVQMWFPKFCRNPFRTRISCVTVRANSFKFVTAIWTDFVTGERQTDTDRQTDRLTSNFITSHQFYIYPSSVHPNKLGRNASARSTHEVLGWEIC
ncbi:hypothetical protein FKM82_028058 [Ascaphus truei]